MIIRLIRLFVAALVLLPAMAAAEPITLKLAYFSSDRSTTYVAAVKPFVEIGVALAPSDGKTSERLLKSADLALYNGKTAGRNLVRFFTLEMDEAQQVRHALEIAIRDAMANDGFVLHYQPVFEMTRNRLIGYEALVRLPGKDGTLIPPATFIPVVEDMHLIDKLGAWVLRKACRTATSWPKDLSIAVNLSPVQFESGTITDIVAAALKESGLDREPSRARDYRDTVA